LGTHRATDFPNVRVADAPVALGLLDGSERAKLISLLQGGAICSWARPMMGRTDFVFLPMLIRPLFIPKKTSDDINQTYIRLGTTPEYYDVCMNKAELSRYWPKLEIPESKCDAL
jgi:hypothetical protein